MRTLAAKFRFIALILCLSCMLCGCTSLGEKLTSLNAGQSEDPTDAPYEYTAEPSSTPFDVGDENPVFTLCSGFFRLFQKLSDGIITSAYGSSDDVLSKLCVSFMEDEAIPARLYSAVGMLGRSDSASDEFSGSVTGVFPGEGSIKSDGTFSFEFENGSMLEGSIEDGTLIDCSLNEDGAKTRLTLSMSGGVYTAWVERNGMTGVMELKDEGITYLRFKSSLWESSGKRNALPDVPEKSGFFCSISGIARINP